MLDFVTIKKMQLDKRVTFTKICRIDGRSRQYLFRECKIGNQKVLGDIYKILKKL